MSVVSVVLRRSSLLLFGALFVVGCAGGPGVKRQSYATYSNERTFEYPFDMTWKGIESALRGWKVVERDPEEVEPLELKKLPARSLKTEWIYTQSRDRYHEYRINGSPRKKYLQLRLRYRIEAKAVMGGVTVAVGTDEEVELLGDDGQPRGYEGVDETDTSRAKDMLDKINVSILSAVP